MSWVYTLACANVRSRFLQGCHTEAVNLVLAAEEIYGPFFVIGWLGLAASGMRFLQP
jgi:hypothetical protein